VRACVYVRSGDNAHMYVYVRVCMCVCMCVCVYECESRQKRTKSMNSLFRTFHKSACHELYCMKGRDVGSGGR